MAKDPEFGEVGFNEAVFGESPDVVIPTSPPVTITPQSIMLHRRQKIQFKANQPVNWFSAPPTGGSTISRNGLYTAPPQIKATSMVTVMAASKADPSNWADAVITLTP